MLVRIQQGGASFSSALEAEGNLFPTYVFRMLAVGERSGQLGLSLERVAGHMENESILRSQYMNSFAYPAVVIMVAIGVFIGLSVYVVPEFARIIEGAGDMGDLPFISTVWLDISRWITSYGIFTAIGIAAAGAAVTMAYKTGAAKKEIDNVLINLPFIGANILNTSMAQMGWTMSVLLKSGLSIVESLEFQAGNTGNHNISQSLSNARDAIIEGRSLGYGLNQPHIPSIVRNMCIVGERSGELEKAAQVFGDYFQRESQNRTKKMTAIMEPVLILLIGGMVAFIYISFFQALFSINGGLR